MRNLNRAGLVAIMALLGGMFIQSAINATPSYADVAPSAATSGASAGSSAPAATPHFSNFDTQGNTPGQVAPAGSGSTSVGAAQFNAAGVQPFGNAVSYGAPTNITLASPAVAMASTPSGHGYWIVAADGGVFAYGDAKFYGSAGGIVLYAPIVGISSTPDGKGYWLVAIDGGVFAYGDAKFYGSMGGRPLNSPVVGMAPTPSGHGYWMDAADGGIFAFGDAQFRGSMGGQHLNSAVVGMAASHDGFGYWLVAGDGGMFSFGDAPFYGSEGGTSLSSSIAGMATTSDGGGYWLVGSNGAVFTFGDAPFHGANNMTVPTPPVMSIAPTNDNGGYWLLEPDAFPINFSHPISPSSVPNARGIVTMAANAIAGDPDQQGAYCNPYGPCEPWCALFVTAMWGANGIGIPHYGFTGDIWNWSAGHGGALPGNAAPQPGMIVLYGTGPGSAGTSVHTGLVGETWPDGAMITIEGDAGPGPTGRHDVIFNGPFLPSHSGEYNGFGIYGYAQN